MHVARRRPAVSWPAALLPGALALALMTASATTTTAGGAPVEERTERPVTELQVVDAGH